MHYSQKLKVHTVKCSLKQWQVHGRHAWFRECTLQTIWDREYTSTVAETADLCAETQVVAEMFNHIVHQVHKALVECIVFTLHVCISSNMHQHDLHKNCTLVLLQIKYTE